MRRIKSACIIQKLHFLLREGEEHEEAVRLVKEDIERYKQELETKMIKYKVLEEEQQRDGSIVVEIKKQYSVYPVEEYLD